MFTKRAIILVKFFIINLFVIVHGQAQSGTVSTAPVFGNYSVESFADYLIQQLDMPRSIYEKEVNGKLIVSMQVLATGGISEIRIVKNLFPDFDIEVLNLLRNTQGKWTPGFNNGVPITSTVILYFVPKLEVEKGVKIRKYLNEAKSNEVSEKYKQALKNYNKILLLLPDDPATIIDVARMYTKLGNIAEACRQLMNCSSNTCQEYQKEWCR